MILNPAMTLNIHQAVKVTLIRDSTMTLNPTMTLNIRQAVKVTLIRGLTMTLNIHQAGIMPTTTMKHCKIVVVVVNHLDAGVTDFGGHVTYFIRNCGVSFVHDRSAVTYLSAAMTSSTAVLVAVAVFTFHRRPLSAYIAQKFNKGKGKGRYSYSWGNPTSELRDVTCHMESHSATCHPTQVNAPRLTPATEAGTRFTYPGGCSELYTVVQLIAPWPRVELATFRSRVRRRTTEPPRQPKS